MPETFPLKLERRVYSTRKEKPQMPDRDTELIEQLIGTRLEAIAKELEHLNQILESFKTATQRETQAIETQQASLASAQRAFGTPGNLLSGRWHRRDGNVYGIVAAQPPLKLPEPRPPSMGTDPQQAFPHADDPPGHLRPPDQR
jgi:hypothetical protein